MRGTQSINHLGHLTIGGVDTTWLAQSFGTPLYVYDVALMKQNVNLMKQAFEEFPVQWQIAYASKAFSSVAMYQLVDQLGLALDVVSGGELYTAIQAGLDPKHIHFHGNNKSEQELSFALDQGIGTIIVDNDFELDMLSELTVARQQSVDVLFRITPGVEAHTHEYITTGQEDSKFGFNVNDQTIENAVRLAQSHSLMNLKGLHWHIGSQIFESMGFVTAIKNMFGHIKAWRDRLGFTPEILNVGGGFGIQYTKEDDPIPLDTHIREIVQQIQQASEQLKMPVPEVWVEPGRALVGEAGTTLYTAGAKKHVPGIRTYLSVDGGMTDNLRPALYQSKYEAMNASKADIKADQTVSLAGKCCESGDMLIWDACLPETLPGDLIAVFCTGAYGYSMANNYNRLPRPAVVFVENGDAQLVVRRETYADLVRHDLDYTLSLSGVGNKS
ncbi:diaminopimelate decarboxylase [Tuberibacillus sp. Marseille-P3662]|uniref:diaminopimelate decarboxylase n=1 Tax=Tuberibacillus sp. Marseille-P3662 TaxID=1965358 RepID=UPI000A1CBC85|nr:diaminopimelate decarboxylase [Tuberibacillus sp. Marseille-P3662]